MLVGIDADKDDATVPNRLLAAGKTLYHFANIHVHHLKLKAGLLVSDAIALLQKLPGFTYAEPDCTCQTALPLLHLPRTAGAADEPYLATGTFPDR